MKKGVGDFVIHFNYIKKCIYNGTKFNCRKQWQKCFAIELRTLSLLTVLLLCQTGCVFLSLAKERPPQITVPFSRGTKPFNAHVAYTNFENADFDFLPFASLGEPNQNYSKKTLLFKNEILKRLPVTIQSKLSVAEFTLIFSEVQDTKNYGWLWFSALSFGILPTKLDAEKYMRLKVFESSGKRIGDYTSRKFQYDVYGGIFLIVPMMFSERRKDVSSVELVENGLMLDDVLSQAIEAGNF